MFHLSEQEKVARLEGEVVMWFRQAQEEHQRAEQMAARVRGLKEEIDRMQARIDTAFNKLADDADRFEAISEFWHAARKTGYNTSWSIGGITVEALREETNLARNYKAPQTVLESDLVVVGKMDRDGALYRKNVIVPHRSAIEVVYVYRPKTALKVNTDKTSKVKGISKV